MSARARTTTTEKGRAAEELAVAALTARGYEILARNVRRARGEVDVVAREGDVLCFVEVRSRKSARRGGPDATVTTTKQARIARAAAAWLAERGGVPPRCRFDVVAITGGGDAFVVDVIRGAFEAP